MSSIDWEATLIAAFRQAASWRLGKGSSHKWKQQMWRTPLGLTPLSRISLRWLPERPRERVAREEGLVWIKERFAKLIAEQLREMCFNRQRIALS